MWSIVLLSIFLKELLHGVKRYYNRKYFRMFLLEGFFGCVIYINFLKILKLINYILIYRKVVVIMDVHQGM